MPLTYSNTAWNILLRLPLQVLKRDYAIYPQQQNTQKKSYKVSTLSMGFRLMQMQSPVAKIQSYCIDQTIF